MVQALLIDWLRNSVWLLHHCIWSLHWICLALDAVILIMVQQVRLMIFSLNMVEHPMSISLLSLWIFLGWTSRVHHSKFVVRPLHHALKFRVVGKWPKWLCVSPSPLGTNRVLELINTWLGLGFGGFGHQQFILQLEIKSVCCTSVNTASLLLKCRQNHFTKQVYTFARLELLLHS